MLLKKQSGWGNNKSHMNKFVRCAIMKRYKLKNKANKTKHPIDIKMYKKQRNYVVGLNKKMIIPLCNKLSTILR